MTEIELTDAQRQALQADQGKPVEVIDPATQQRYVLLAWEQYDRIRSHLEGGQGPGQSLPGPPASPFPGEAEAVRVRLRDLPTPAEVLEEAERWCKKYGCRGKQRRQEVEEQLKVQYYYGGQAVYVLNTPKGKVVVPIPERYRNTPDLRYILLTPEERAHASLNFPSRWGDTDSEILI